MCHITASPGQEGKKPKSVKVSMLPAAADALGDPSLAGQSPRVPWIPPGASAWGKSLVLQGPVGAKALYCKAQLGQKPCTARPGDHAFCNRDRTL